MKFIKKIIERNEILLKMNKTKIFSLMFKNNYFYNKKIVFSVKEICCFSNINVPSSLKDKDNLFLFDVDIFDVKDKDVVKKRIINIEYITKQVLNIYKFKEKYDTQECFEKNDIEYLKMFVHWYYFGNLSVLK